MRLNEIMQRPQKPKKMKTIAQIANLPKVKTFDELSPFPKEMKEEDESDCHS